MTTLPSYLLQLFTKPVHGNDDITNRAATYVYKTSSGNDDITELPAAVIYNQSRQRRRYQAKWLQDIHKASSGNDNITNQPATDCHKTRSGYDDITKATPATDIHKASPGNKGGYVYNWSRKIDAIFETIVACPSAAQMGLE